MTVPTKNRFEPDFETAVVKPHDLTRPITLTNQIAVERLICLLHEVVAQGGLPAL
jgi:hypothetical protein